jgi:hypothetical protein
MVKSDLWDWQIRLCVIAPQPIERPPKFMQLKEPKLAGRAMAAKKRELGKLTSICLIIVTKSQVVNCSAPYSATNAE